MMDENPYAAPQEKPEPNGPRRWPANEKADKENRSSFERWGVASTASFLVGLAGAVFLFGVLVTNLWPGAGRPDFPGFPLMVLTGVIWTAGALLLAWALRR
jgi:hypothetical protein